MYNVINKDHLKIETHLESGGRQGTDVFKGVWHRPDEPAVEVAIKKMHLLDYQPQDIENMFRELYIMQSLSCETNICKMYGACEVRSETAKEVWIVMQYVDGGDLHKFIKQQKRPLTREEQLGFMFQASRTMQVLHNTTPSPIMHRDVKSLNFLVQKDTCTLFLTDFGLSKPLKLTTSKTPTVGTIRWMAPETVRRKKKWTPLADIYSLGLVLFEILTSELPYEGIDCVVTLIKMKKRGVLPKFPDNCPKEFITLIKKCCECKPQKRPHINDLVRDLGTGRPPLARNSFPMIEFAEPVAIQKSRNIFSWVFRSKKVQASATNAIESTNSNEANRSALINIAVEEEGLALETQ